MEISSLSVYTLYSPSPPVLLRSFRALLSLYFYLFFKLLVFLIIYLWFFIAVYSLYLVVVHGFLIVVAFLVAEQALGHMGFVVMVHGLSCPKAGGILVSGSGIKPMSPALAGGVLTTGPLQKSLSLPFSYLLSAGERAEDSCFSSPTRPWVCSAQQSEVSTHICALVPPTQSFLLPLWGRGRKEK